MRALLVTLALCALGAAGCGGGGEPSASPPEGTATTTMEAVPDDGAGRPAAPPIEGVSLDGEPVALADFAGRPVLVNVWSSW
ncbi:MAG TPA: hypothetical protein VMN35_03395 [Gaiellaceae bacterium]|nr:hypothetical protein [Gaiellaceae bacterium]